MGMCKAAKKMHQQESDIRGDASTFDTLTLLDSARWAQIALDLQKLRLDHEAKCHYCEAERVSEALTHTHPYPIA